PPTRRLTSRWLAIFAAVAHMVEFVKPSRRPREARDERRSPPGSTASVSAWVESRGGRSRSRLLLSNAGSKGNQRAREASGPEAGYRLEQHRSEGPWPQPKRLYPPRA